MSHTITVSDLSAAAFAPYGDVVEAMGDPAMVINAGRCGRYHDLATLDFDSAGQAGISIFRSQPVSLPLQLDLVERHPLGTQCFLPISGHSYLVVVATDDQGAPAGCQAFLARPDQGVNYHRNTWHGVLMPIGGEASFAVVDWVGDGNNLEEFRFKQAITIIAAPDQMTNAHNLMQN